MTSTPAASRTGLAALAVLLLSASGCGAQRPTEEPVDSSGGPVITPAEPWESYPLAEVGGDLALREGCLLLGDELVFWPHGTTFDESAGSVVFADGPPAVVGTSFTGGGGHYPAGTDFTAWLGAETGEAISACQQSTGVSRVVFAYPA
ncbi:hypothetical protein ASG88_20125 [Nocardioides sp. Soil777]|uniref:hypothetical protein n=1 Tax=Nocardioides sp. Soil777 TaxID=1736409 RepID=UPI00070369B4|nr:hypothetical protein [Nocardioides sp. Soil777]KRF06457.1 hypothetical protein ASG88_20125 [Nocardioides sp. Soil777]